MEDYNKTVRGKLAFKVDPKKSEMVNHKEVKHKAAHSNNTDGHVPSVFHVCGCGLDAVITASLHSSF